MLIDSTLPDAEEFAIHDYEGFGPLRLDEYESLETVSLIAQGIARHGAAFAHWVTLVGTTQPADLELFEEQYEGHHESLAAYAEQLPEDLYTLDELDTLQGTLPQALRPYIRLDIEAFALDMLYGGDIMTSEGDGGIYVFCPL
jgi:antirestriction protein